MAGGGHSAACCAGWQGNSRGRSSAHADQRELGATRHAKGARWRQRRISFVLPANDHVLHKVTMAIFLDTTGNATLGIGLCARCSRKMPLGDLSPDPNAPGLMVCVADKDDYDPYRLAPRAPDQIVLPFVRPDTSLDN